MAALCFGGISYYERRMNTPRFIFESTSFDEESGVLRLAYSFSGGDSFEEVLEFPPSRRALTPTGRQALERIFRLLFLLSGVSYYKAFAPETMACKAFPIDRETAAFVEEVYGRGLAEFAYRNRLDMRGRAKFDTSEVSGNAPDALALEQPHHAGVPIGGGKDSLLTYELLKQAQEPLTLFAVGSGEGGVAPPIQAAFDRSGAPSVIVLRHLSPRLRELSSQGALNGHVPVTAIISAIAVAAAILYGWDSIVLSNERSANVGNLHHEGFEINHQYSKSFAFEDAFAGYVERHITPNIATFSLLRPLSEAGISRRFAELRRWHDCFRSCNSAFRQDPARRGTAWCCACPKCRFVFLALAPFLPRLELVRIFGGDLLDDAAQMRGYEELCGLAAHKPFECVGEISECSTLLQRLGLIPDWGNSFIVKALAARLPISSDALDRRWEDLMAPDYCSPHRIPERFRILLDSFGQSCA